MTPEQLRAALQKAPGLLAGTIRDALFLYGQEFAKRTFPSKRLSGPPGLERRSGYLAASFDAEVEGSTLGDLALRVFTTAHYAPTHEFGATIRARNFAYLHFRLPNGAWVKVKEVTIPARLQFVETFKQDAARRESVLGAAVGRALAAVGAS